MKKNHKGRGNYGQNNYQSAYILVKEHAVDQFLLRSKKKMSREDAKKTIMNMVKQTRLIGMESNQEHRSHKGFVFVCKREYNGSSETLVVVTMKLSFVKQKELFSTDFSKDTIDFKAFHTQSRVS